MSNFNNYSNSRSGGPYGRPANTNQSGSYGRPAQTAASTQPVKKEIPAEYVDEAQKIIKGMIQYDNRGNIRKGITATKLRNLFGLFSDLYNQMLRQEEEQLTENQMDTLRTARIRIVYECGREQDVKNFVERTNILSYLASVDNSKEKLTRFYHYMEALVAFARYTGLTGDK